MTLRTRRPGTARGKLDTMRITTLVGNPNPASRTLAVAETAAASLFDLAKAEHRVIDLAEHVADVFAWPCASMDEMTAAVATSNVVFVASPTYKATYTGLLKSFLDRYPSNGLDGVVAIPVMTGADLTHALAPEVHLRSLLVELGATVPTRGLYFVTSNFDRLDEVVGLWVDENRRRLRAVVDVGCQ